MTLLRWLTSAVLLSSLAIAGCGDDTSSEGDAGDGDGDGDASAGDGDGDGDAGNDDAGDGDSGVTNGAQAGTTITLADGVLEGKDDGEARAFLGIPYAKPPVGELRWKAPQDVEPWDGTYPAMDLPPSCAQLMSLQGPQSENEDCLYLNVWAPADAPDEPLPVMFWIHGGGNTVGSIADEVPLGVGELFYNGRTLAESYGVVVVTANYRLGALGFFPHPDLADEDSPLGNQGLLDQRKAMEWVRDNITAFGGDPDNVTVFGESAGSFDTCFHVASPGSRGLFHRAISQSGGCTTTLGTAADAEENMAAFAEAMGCADAEDQLACLRDVDPAELIVAPPIDGAPAEVLPGGNAYQGGTPRWGFNRPVIDGDILPDQPRALFEAGDVARVPYILGSNTDEGTLFHLGSTPVADELEYQEALVRRFGDRAAEIAAVYPVSDFDSANAALERVSGDVGLVCGTYDTAVRAADAGLAVYMYNFDLPIAVPGYEALGAVHGAEIAYVFGSVAAADATAMMIGEAMQAYWSTFAATGDPNHAGALEWPSFDADNNLRINFGTEISIVEDFRAQECEFWRAGYEAASPF